MLTALRNDMTRLAMRLASIAVFSLLFVGCASYRTAQSDFYFLPCAPKASVSFEGETQAGRGIHRLEVRRLAYMPPGATEGQKSKASCVIYYAGDEYDPRILRVLDDCVDPLVRRASKDVVEVYFLAGAHTHIRQQWRLLPAEATAKLELEEAIDWSDDPRTKTDADEGKTALRKLWLSPDYTTNSVPTIWCPQRVPTPVTNVAEFERFPASESFSIPKFIARYGLPSRYLKTERNHGQDFLIYDLPSGHAVALYVPKPPIETFAAAVIITSDGSLVKLIK